MLARLGGLVYQHPKQTLLAAGVVLSLSVSVPLRGGHLVAGKISGLEAERADQRAAEVVGASSDNTVIAVFSRPDLSANNREALAAIDRALVRVRGDPRV